MDNVTKDSKNKIEDLALLCGCEVYNKLEITPAETLANPDRFIGHAEKVIITPKTTQVIAKEENYNTKKIQTVIKNLESDLKKMDTIEVPTNEEAYLIYALRQRLSRLKGSSAILHVGGKTYTERVTRQRLIEDSVFACKSAIQYGFIPGGNLIIPKVLLENKYAFSSILGEKYKYIPVENLKKFLFYFIDIIANAFLESYRAVLNNSSMDEDAVEDTISECLSNNKFYNLKLHRYEDWNETTIINSVRTDIEILRSCISLIGILSTSNQFMTLNFNVTDQIIK